MKKENWLPSMNFARMTIFRALAGEMHVLQVVVPTSYLNDPNTG